MNSVPQIRIELCTGCGVCVEKCPTGAVGLRDGKAVMLNPEDCIYCTSCESICPAGAVSCPFDIILVGSDN